MAEYVGIVSSTQWGNPVLGGGTEALYAQDVSHRLQAVLAGLGIASGVYAGQTDSNADGVAAALADDATLIISIHFDGGYMSESHWASMILYADRNLEARARALLYSFCSKIGNTPRGVQWRPPGTQLGVSVLSKPYWAGVPAYLFELEWMDREPDASRIRSESGRRLYAKCLGAAIAEYLGITQPRRRGEKIMIPSPVQTTHVFPDVWPKLGPNWIHIKSESAELNSAQVIITTHDLRFFTKTFSNILGYQDLNFDLNAFINELAPDTIQNGEGVSITVITTKSSAVSITPF